MNIMNPDGEACFLAFREDSVPSAAPRKRSANYIHNPWLFLPQTGWEGDARRKNEEKP
jgi:hypothetical protein